MQHQKRLTSIDLFRGLAVYAVVILHSGNGKLPDTQLATVITHFSGFAVPFFLATSFYLAVSKLYKYKTQYPIQSRLLRLLIPYGIWSLIYLLYRGGKYLISNRLELVQETLQDPLALFFLGASSYHLYFIPLLVTGTFLLKVAEILIEKQVSLKTVLLSLIFSISIYEFILITNNSFDLNSNIAFQGILAIVLPAGNNNPFLRFVLVELAWLIRCLPYIFTAMLLNNLSIDKYFLKRSSNSTIVLMLVGFILINLTGSFILPKALYELLRGYFCLILAITLTNKIKSSHIITNLGLCSFGIYFVHLIVVEVSKSVINKVYSGIVNHVSAPTLLTIATIIFLLSWLITALLIKNKPIAKLIFSV